jgi:hypothetical protein
MSKTARPGLVEFLRARLDEIADVALNASGSTVVGEPGNWRSVPGGDEWVYHDNDGDIEVLVPLRPGMARPPNPSNGYWAAVCSWSDDFGDGNRWVRMVGPHIAMHDPRSVLAEVEWKRRIIEQWEYSRPNTDGFNVQITTSLEWVMGQMIQQYADHPDFDPDWRI